MPLVSIVTATYNRSSVLKYTIASVLASTFKDWEMLVIGDACTDDTAQVVAGFNDPRIRFTNLQENCGEQTGPNNLGFDMARGEYITVLNHDDFYFPEHLESQLAYLNESKADLVFCAHAQALPTSREELAGGKLNIRLHRLPPDNQYHPYLQVPALGWMLKKSYIKDLGGWKFSHQTLMAPSNEFVFRGWKSGKKILFNPRITVLSVPSGNRKNSYHGDHDYESEFFWNFIQTDPGFRQKLFEAIAIQQERERTQLAAFPSLWHSIYGQAHKVLYRPLLAMGISPLSISALIEFGWRGSMIRKLRQNRGLEENRR